MTADASAPGWRAPFRDPRFGPSFLRWGLLGVLVRVLLLPVGITSDTLAVYWRAHLIAFHGDVFEGYLVNMGSHVLHALWLLAVQPLMGPSEQLWTHPWWWSDPNGLVAEHMTALLTRPDALRVVSLLKVPYVLADLAAGLVLLSLLWPAVEDRDTARELAVSRAWRAWIFWMLSPAALYATLIFGRYESFPVLAVVVALWLLERGHAVWAGLVLGLAITLRTYPVLFVPVVALVWYRDLPRQVAWSVLAVTPFALTMGLNRLVGGTYGELAAAGDFSFGGNFFAFALQPERGGPGLFLFVAAVFALGTYLLGRARGWWGMGPVPRTQVWRWLVLAHLAIFAFSQFSPHYLMWITPAVALLLGRTGRPGIAPLHLAQIVGVVVAQFVLVGGVIFTGALGGLGPTATTLLPLNRPMEGSVADQVVNVAWTGFWVATLALALPFLLATVRADPRAGPSWELP
ncbi:MAG TPA: glycosyltransferase family 87 protein [Nitriliruptorales bacterium]|nr:glycosyltransferase family 87 protein [Nitriliruptorales bacterium]